MTDFIKDVMSVHAHMEKCKVCKKKYELSNKLLEEIVNHMSKKQKRSRNIMDAVTEGMK